MTGRMSCLEVRSRGSAWPACSTTGEHYSAFHGHSVIWNQERENGCSQSVEDNCMEEPRPSSQYSRAMVHKWLATGRKLDIGG